MWSGRGLPSARVLELELQLEDVAPDPAAAAAEAAAPALRPCTASWNRLIEASADLSPTGVKAVTALKDGLDPKGVMNPGKIIPSEHPLAEWGLTEEAIQSFKKGN